MPRFKQLAAGEQPANPDKFILIEVIREPAIGYQYRVTGKGLDPDYQQSSGSWTVPWTRHANALGTWLRR